MLTPTATLAHTFTAAHALSVATDGGSETLTALAFSVYDAEHAALTALMGGEAAHLRAALMVLAIGEAIEAQERNAMAYRAREAYRTAPFEVVALIMVEV